jgi:hypothetical protein
LIIGGSRGSEDLTESGEASARVSRVIFITLVIAMRMLELFYVFCNCETTPFLPHVFHQSPISATFLPKENS